MVNAFRRWPRMVSPSPQAHTCGRQFQKAQGSMGRPVWTHHNVDGSNLMESGESEPRLWLRWKKTPAGNPGFFNDLFVFLLGSFWTKKHTVNKTRLTARNQLVLLYTLHPSQKTSDLTHSPQSIPSHPTKHPPPPIKTPPCTTHSPKNHLKPPTPKNLKITPNHPNRNTLQEAAPLSCSQACRGLKAHGEGHRSHGKFHQSLAGRSSSNWRPPPCWTTLPRRSPLLNHARFA